MHDIDEETIYKKILEGRMKANQSEVSKCQRFNDNKLNRLQDTLDDLGWTNKSKIPRSRMDSIKNSYVVNMVEELAGELALHFIAMSPVWILLIVLRFLTFK